jgi:hypothetical protein
MLWSSRNKSVVYGRSSVRGVAACTVSYGFCRSRMVYIFL